MTVIPFETADLSTSRGCAARDAAVPCSCIETALLIRSSSARAWGALQFGLVGVCFCVVALSSRSIGCGALGALLIVLAVRSARLEVRCSEDVLMARNLLWTWRIPIESVEEFALQEGGRFSLWLRLPGSSVLCRRRGKRAVPLLATQWIHSGRTDFYGRITDPPSVGWLAALRQWLGRANDEQAGFIEA